MRILKHHALVIFPRITCGRQWQLSYFGFLPSFISSSQYQILIFGHNFRHGTECCVITVYHTPGNSDWCKRQAHHPSMENDCSSLRSIYGYQERVFHITGISKLSCFLCPIFYHLEKIYRREENYTITQRNGENHIEET